MEYKGRKVRVQLRIKDWEKMFKKSVKSRRGFVITDRNGLEDKKSRSENGIYSSKYGTVFGDENAFADRYRCKCFKTISKNNQGVICPHCGTEVKYKEVDLKIFGWFELEEDFLIHPNIFRIIESLVGAKTLKEILNFEKGSDIKGHYSELDFEEIKKCKNIDKYKDIGMKNFRKHFEDIIYFYYTKKKHKKKEYDFLIQHKKQVFVKHIPVYTLYLRPVTLSGSKFSYNDINKKLQALSTKVWTLNNDEFAQSKKNRLQTLFSAQVSLNSIYAMILDSLSQKEGDIRGVSSGRYNFTERSVIVPYSGSKIDEIRLPYLGFLELYKPEIINLITKFENVTVMKALEKWNKAKVKFDKKIYQIMNYLIENTKSGLYLIINR